MAGLFALAIALILGGGLPGITSAAEPAPTNSFRVHSLASVTGGEAGFRRIEPRASGVIFTNSLPPSRHHTNQILLNGSGLACGDVDGDGRTDVFFASLAGTSTLYRNLGDWKFEDVTERAGVRCAGLTATGALLVDLDGDQDLDLLVSSLGQGTHLFQNDGQARFTRKAVLNGRAGGTSMACADLDGNGSLDLYIANYRTETLRDQPNTKFSIRMIEGQPRVTHINGRPISEPDLANRYEFRFTFENGRLGMAQDENGEPDSVYLNDGRGNLASLAFTNGAFRDTAEAPLRQPPFDWGLSVMLRDLTGDGAPDIYVCNDFKSPDRIWINNGRGTFRPIAPTAIRQTCLSSMGMDAADLNHDGRFDLFVLDMLSRDHRRRLTQKVDVAPEPAPPGDTHRRVQSARNTLLLAREDGTYAEIAQFAGLAASEWSWTPIFIDVDLDGHEDLLISNGFARDGMNIDVVRQIEAAKRSRQMGVEEQLSLRRMFPRLETANLAFRNLGNLTFADVSAAWRFDASAISHGMALADFDNDGDLDVAVNNMNAAAFLYRNDTAAPRVAVRLHGLPPNTRGIGAKITVTGGPAPQMQEMISGGRYLSGDDAVRVFAAGRVTNVLRIEIAWRSGRRSVIENARPNFLYEIDELRSSEKVPRAPRTNALPLFEDVSAAIQHRHEEAVFDDFARQPLLLNRLSQLGPGLSWFDLDGDGREELCIGGGQGSALAVYRNRGDGRFERWRGAPLDQPATRDQTAVLGWTDESGKVVLLAGSANWEDGMRSGSVVHQYFIESRTIGDSLPGNEASTGPIVLGDLEGDGKLELFVGARAWPGKYPQPGQSLLFRRVAGAWRLDEGNTRVLSGVGNVSSALFTDLDADGLPELVLACELGPVRVFSAPSGKLAETTARFGLDQFSGWWNAINAGDFDGDGRLDLVAANWGANSKFDVVRPNSWRLYFGDFDGDGIVEQIEAYREGTTGEYVPARNHEALVRGLPWLQPKFSTWESVSTVSVAELLGDRFPAAQVFETTWLRHTVFLNRDNRFTAVPLPDEAQFAPAFGTGVADFDGDGREDIFLAQNFFATNPDTSRCDAGRGLVLRGDGSGGFHPLTGTASGIVAYGEQRGAAVGDFDGDGRADLAVGQNGAETKLFRNARGAPGLRVRLNGPAGNPQGIGAVLRLGDGSQWGPAREVHAGAGYWSQDSSVQVLSGSPATKLRVRWPGGRVEVSDIPAGAREVSVDTDGGLEVVR